MVLDFRRNPWVHVLVVCGVLLVAGLLLMTVGWFLWTDDDRG